MDDDTRNMRFDLIRGKLRTRDVAIRMLGNTLTMTFGRWVELSEELKDGALKTLILENLHDEYLAHAEEAIIL